MALQDDAHAAGGECLIFIADLHALSMPHDPAELRASTLELVATLVACGLDPDKAILFNQAQVPQHTELQWLLNGNRADGLAEPHDPVEGQGRQEPRRPVGRAVHLPGAAGRRRPAVSGDPCAGGRGPEAASGTGPRHRAEIQQ